MKFACVSKTMNPSTMGTKMDPKSWKAEKFGRKLSQHALKVIEMNSTCLKIDLTCLLLLLIILVKLASKLLKMSLIASKTSIIAYGVSKVDLASQLL